MDNPVLVRPTNKSTFLPDEIIRFEWQTESAGPVPVKLDLYIGRDSAKPYEDPGVVVRRWLLRPGNVWTGYNESADVLGLHPGETYYWQVVRGKPDGGNLFSDVRSFRIKPLYSAVPYGFRIRINHPDRILLGSRFTIELLLENGSTELVRLNYPTKEHFAIEVYQQRGILSEKYVWPKRTPLTKNAHHLDIRAGTTLAERIFWDQKDTSEWRVVTGSYRLVVWSLAIEYRSSLSRDFRIFV